MMEASCSRFTAAEGGARLAAAAATKNILAVEYASFIPVRLLYEKAYQIRGSLFDGKKRSIYITRATRVPVVTFELNILTDLATVSAQEYGEVYDWAAELDTKEVVICTSSVLKGILEAEILTISNINIMIIDSCHLIYKDEDLKYIMKKYKSCPQEDQPTILALTYPLFTSKKQPKDNDEEEMGVYENLDDFNMYEKLEWKIEELEQELCCQMDLAEDIDGGKRMSASATKPRELIIEFGSKPSDDELAPPYRMLEHYMRESVHEAMAFVEDHRHDPTEIYGEELYEEFMNIPDPTLDPKQIFKQFLYVLDLLGPYAADKAAFSLLMKLEKLKIKIPYERHFLLLCLCTTVFIKIRCYADYLFNQIEDEWEKIKTFSSTKVLRFAEILEKFQPPELKNSILAKDSSDSQSKAETSVKTKKMLADINECDFNTLGDKLEDKVNTLVCNLKEIYDYPAENVTLKPDTVTDSSDVTTEIKDSCKNEIKDNENTSKSSKLDTQINIENTLKDIPSKNQDSLKSTKNSTLIQTDSKTKEITIKDENIETISTNEDITKVNTIPPDSSPDCSISGPDSGVSRPDSRTSGPDSRTSGPDSRISVPDSGTNVPDSRIPGPDSRISGPNTAIQTGLLGFTRRTGHRLRGRTRLQRNNAARVLQMQQNPDALCGIVYMKEALIAKIMFMIIVDMSRVNPKLAYLCAQYCATESPADPGTEPRECQRQGKKQEEVLKKFRMHECNLLLATSALEEGIDLPRCNLVLRWDVPPSYRSYGLCRGRARAARSSAALLCSDNKESTDMLLQHVAIYKELDQIISRKCGCGIQDEPPQSEEDYADTFTTFIQPYTPNDGTVKDIKDTKDSGDRKDDVTIKGNMEKSKDLKDVVTKKDEKATKDIKGDITIKEKDNTENIKDAKGEVTIKDTKGDVRMKDTVNTEKIKDTKHDIIMKDTEKIKDDVTITDKDNFEDIKDMKSKGNTAERIEEAFKEKDKNFDGDGTNIGVEKNACIVANLNPKDETKNIKDKATEALKVTENGYLEETTKNDGDNDIANIVSKTADININDEILQNSETGEIELKNVAIIEQKVDQDILPNKELISTVNDDSTSKIEHRPVLPVTNETTPPLAANSKIEDKVLASKINRDEILANVYCNKCFNVKLNNVCCCDNVTLYYTLLAKVNSKVVKSESKKSVCEDSVASVPSVASVDMSTAIALINRYCGKLPSDTFTRLAPQWWMERLQLPSPGCEESSPAYICTLRLPLNCPVKYNIVVSRYSSYLYTVIAQWWMEQLQLPSPGCEESSPAYICTLRLPLNCPVKYNIVGHPMPTKVLARRMVALQACRILHKSGELDNQLMPIGKENFKAVEMDTTHNVGGYSNEATDMNDAARPGTTKRRQYYYKRTAWAFTDCQPVVDSTDAEIEPPPPPGSNPDAEPTGKEPYQPKIIPGKKRNMLYAIVSKLWCALPERYNTRGRRLHAPQNASQAIGILMARHEPDSLQIPAFPVYTRSGEVRVSVEHVPDADVRLSPRRGRLVRRLQIPAFPVYTRSGEVRVSVEHVPDADVRLSPRRGRLVRRFMKFVFAEVLRVRRRGMKLQSEGSTHNNYYIVPTVKTTKPDGTSKIDIDWSFLELIYDHTENKKLNEIEKPILWQPEEEKENGRRRRKKKLSNPLLEGDDTFVFDAEKYREAVVTPWYRNQDQPQFFLVAEICWNLSPDSSFPSATHQSFRDYYSSKYGVTLTQREQPLLDVDHTSARLNLLTPRYVNRKGVALPVSSERTRRAKRDRLDQKQILVPELCRVHPFAAPLWFATVALPCVLYRINALLIADEIRRAVAIDVGLGIPKINEKTMPGFQWPALDFGWSLAEVLNADSEKNEKKKEEELKREQKEKELREKEEQERLEKEEKERLEEEQKNEVVKEKTINDILQEKLDAEGFEIGTWSNDMASAIPEEIDEMLEPLPPNLTFCTSASGGASWSEPIAKPKFSNQYNPTRDFSMADSDDSYMSSDLDSDDTDLDFEGSDEDTDTSGFSSSKNTNAAMGVRIEYKTAHEAEAVDVERCKKVKPAPAPDDADDARDRDTHDVLIRQGTAPKLFIDKFHESVSKHKKEIIDKGDLITQEQPIKNILPETKDNAEKSTKPTLTEKNAISLLFPYGDSELIVQNGQIDVESIERNKRKILEKYKKNLSETELKKLNCFSMNDINIDSKDYVNEKVVNVGFDSKEVYVEKCERRTEFTPYYEEGKRGKSFDFDYQPKLEGHPGPSPSVILQALTMSNANDGINLERLETIGDSFLKFAITAYLYCAHPTVHEGKLSHMRSKQVSNLNLYRLGRNKRLGARMIASKFEPHDNWLPPCHKPPPTLHPRINGDGVDIMQHLETPLDSAGCFIPYNLITQHSIPDKSIADCVEALIGAYLLECGPRGALLFMSWLGIRVLPSHRLQLPPDHPYVCREESKNKQGPVRAYLLECGPRGALLFMSWLGIRVLPGHRLQLPPDHPYVCREESKNKQGPQKSSPPPTPKRNRSTSSSSDCSSGDESPLQQQEVFPAEDWSWPGRAVGSLQPYRDDQGRWLQPIFGELKAPPSPLLRYIQDPEGELEQMLSGYEALERTLQYRFADRSLLLQALTHASHHTNRLTDCYQRLEFLGDAILDYLITRHLYEDPRRHSPGALTDLRSALVNNTIFATLAARHGFHKYFRHMSPGLNEVLTKYVKIQEENGHSISEEHYLIQEDEMEQAEDVEVPKALGDLFESVAGAIFLDSGMSLGAVWRSYVSLMGAELEAFSAAAPKSPVRELLEAEPDTATFGKPERLADGRRVRVCVEVFGRGTFKGVGRNYRIAKGTAARCALRHLRVHRAR